MDKIFLAKMVLATVLLIIGVIFLYWYTKRAIKEQKIKVNKFLLWAVAQAQIDLGSDTGPLKLSKVYGLFLSVFPAKITSKIPFALFEAMVIAAKAELVNLQKENPAIDKVITGSTEVPK